MSAQPQRRKSRLERAADSKSRADKFGILVASSAGAGNERGNASGAGDIVLDDGEVAWDVRQRDILNAVPEQDRARMLNLHLSFGPYKAAYTPTGRDITLVGANGHLACINLRDASLRGETHLSQACRAVTYLHDESLVAVAQHAATFIYQTADASELHCLTDLPFIDHLTFLKQHYILAAAGRHGRVSWFDVSVGRRLATARTGRGPTTALAHNPQSGIVAAGCNGGVVTFWTPNTPQAPAVTLLAATSPISHVRFFEDGTTFVTASNDAVVRVWDVRTMRPMHAFSTGGCVSALDVSQRGTLAVSVGGRVTTFTRDALMKHADGALVGARTDTLATRMRAVAIAADAASAKEAPRSVPRGHGGRLSGVAAAAAAIPMPGEIEVGLRFALPSDSAVTDLRFCPFSDVLAVAHRRGIASMYVPGAAHAQLSAEGANPYASEKERKDVAVRRLLDKLPIETIVWDPTAVGDVKGGAIGAAALARHGQSLRVKRLKAAVQKRKDERKRALEAVGGGIMREGDEEEKRRRARAYGDDDSDGSSADVGSVRSSSSHSSDWEAAKAARARTKDRRGTKGHYVREHLKDQAAIRRKIRNRDEATDAKRRRIAEHGTAGDAMPDADDVAVGGRKLAAHAAVKQAASVGVGAALGRFL